ncbi:MAG TPA: VOC family protein [Solirubrobacteraceae bacterium]|jgi:hypothetical protein
MQLSFGQPVGSIVQYAYVVEDIERSAGDYVDRLGIGPWFVRGPFRPGARYRGNPNEATLTLARAFSGHAMIELVQQHDDAPSVFHETDGPRRYGFHHWAVFSDAFDREVERYRSFGYEEAYTDRLPSGARIVYVDCTRDLPGMIELVEHTDAQEQVYDTIYRASIDWDGGDPLRPSDR